ncbi:pseudouridine synthase [Pluteus cervinus]|uniref:Pseudouridine synthase n=1 Tax=Pluteus cervinus TaxID=181527 RepID=A0ACD3AV33_9AGAR|nr:pseudouridine synthase [Pluteus cervinus]
MKLNGTPCARTPARQWIDSLIYADKRVFVIDKPPGLICQPNPNANRQKLNDFSHLLQSFRREFNLEEEPLPVHRLDKGTTGALVLARSLSTARELSRQFQQGIIQKTYLALVRGGAESFHDQKAGKIRVQLETDDGHVSSITSSNRTGGKPTATDWELLASSDNAPLSLLRLTLLTGHKHQLRVHAAQCLRTPILGDALYSKSVISNLITDRTFVPEGRVFLHASTISMERYRTTGPNKRFGLKIRAPLPADFLRACHDLGILVSSEDARGGLYINGERVEDGKISDVEGKWMGKYK